MSLSFHQLKVGHNTSGTQARRTTYPAPGKLWQRKPDIVFACGQSVILEILNCLPARRAFMTSVYM
jgi:hypothetical protein